MKRQNDHIIDFSFNMQPGELQIFYRIRRFILDCQKHGVSPANALKQLLTTILTLKNFLCDPYYLNGYCSFLQRMMVFDQIHNMFRFNMRINLGCGNIGVA
ncbi:MAG: hypothetical protein CNLJKLNK_00665 [Holosporales bacterium]